MPDSFADRIAAQLAEIEPTASGRTSASSTSPQGRIESRSRAASVLNFCANNYLGPRRPSRARSRPRTRRSTRTATAWPRCASSAARRTSTRSSRRASPTSSAPRTRSSTRSCFDANGGLFETLLGEEDAIISDALNHASIIDGIRLCKAERYRYRNDDMADLEAQLAAKPPAPRFRLIATDGVFSMDGIIAKLAGDLRPRRASTTRWSWSTTPTPPASSAHGRGTPEHCGVDGPRRHHHRHARQGARRRLRRLHHRPRRDHRAAAPALAPVPVLEHARPGHRRRLAQGASTCSQRATELRDRLEANTAASAAG